MRPYWKGYLKLALVSCPIALHAACSSAERIAFRQINKVTGNRLRQQLIDEETCEPVAPEHKGRGYEVATVRSGRMSGFLSRHAFQSATPCLSNATCSSFAMAAPPAWISAPIFLRLPLHRRYRRVLELEPVGRAATHLTERHFSAGSITRSPRSAISRSKEGYLYVSRTQGKCSNMLYSALPSRSSGCTGTDGRSGTMTASSCGILLASVMSATTKRAMPASSETVSVMSRVAEGAKSNRIGR